MALRKPANQSSVSLKWSRFQDPRAEAAGANNGVVDGSQGFTTEQEQCPWWEVDLEAVYRLDEVRIFNRRDWAARLMHFGILGSLDGDSWTELFRKSDDGVFGDKVNEPFVARLPQWSMCRFVRIQLYARDYLHFNECQVFGEPVDIAGHEEAARVLRDRLSEQEQRSAELPTREMTAADLDIELALSQYRYPFPEAELTRTQSRRWILSHAASGGIGAEIGVFRGHFSEMLLSHLSPRKLYLIDPWEMVGEFFYWRDAYTNEGKLPTRVARRDVALRASKFANTEVVMIQGVFPDCRPQILEPLDWVYIDAGHAYESTLEELRRAAEIVKPGGVIFGDDFYSEVGNAHPGVFRAVNEFIRTEPFEFVACGPDGQWCVRFSEQLERQMVKELDAPTESVAFPAIPDGEQHSPARSILGFLSSVREFRSVVEFGGGRTSWLHTARGMGAQIRAYDSGDPPADARGFLAEEFFERDLTQPISLEKRFDLAICLEVAQRLPEEASETLVATLGGASDWVLFGAAIPEQDGIDHQNARWMEYWAGIFLAHGFLCYDILRMKFWHDSRIPYYYRQNTCLYVRPEAQRELRARRFEPARSPPSLVHPELSLRVAGKGVRAGYDRAVAVHDYYRPHR